ncbi:hypothetical protein OnM2_081001 [Erysiphe neolycopersici]|uniref:Uncharacterized protein n=1 Tax=Erysiphe neolycopersici TaxID=212602 RepID=A0A420HG77_9PEZI|nr:hypothetical protein OnM2_081001 [Erysiphe neolycopersici]
MNEIYKAESIVLKLIEYGRIRNYILNSIFELSCLSPIEEESSIVQALLIPAYLRIARTQLLDPKKHGSVYTSLNPIILNQKFHITDIL